MRCARVLFYLPLLTDYRKLVPTAVERLVWGRGSGDSLKVADTEFGNIGGLIWLRTYSSTHACNPKANI